MEMNTEAKGEESACVTWAGYTWGPGQISQITAPEVLQLQPVKTPIDTYSYQKSRLDKIR